MKNLTAFGKETMRRQRETYRVESNRNQRTGTRRTVRCKACVFALFLCGILCGCTSREQLVLEIGDAAQETRSEVPKLQTDIVADVAERTGEVHASGAENAESARAEDAGKEKTASVQIQEPENIFVHVCGAVVSPGVYEMPADSRIYEAVEKAGGFAEDADSSYVNQAGRLADGMKLIIPTVEQTKALSTDENTIIGIVESSDEGQPMVGHNATQQTGGVQGTASDSADTGGVIHSETADGKININTASEAELCNIPGIGSTRAAAIVAYRQESGGFQRIEDIMNVSGIKEGTYNKIKDKIKVY